MIRIKRKKKNPKNYGNKRKLEKFWQSSSFTHFILLFFFCRKELELKCWFICFAFLSWLFFPIFFKVSFFFPSSLYGSASQPLCRAFSINPCFLPLSSSYLPSHQFLGRTPPHRCQNETPREKTQIWASVLPVWCSLQHWKSGDMQILGVILGKSISLHCIW